MRLLESDCAQILCLHLIYLDTHWLPSYRPVPIMSASKNEAKYGGIVGPDAMYVKLISSDYHEFIIKREHALTSGTIKAMLSGPGKSYLIFSIRDEVTNLNYL